MWKFLSTPVQLAARQRKVEKEKETLVGQGRCTVLRDNGNASETKAKESLDNGVFFYIEAKRTPSIVSKLFSKQSEHIR